MPDFINLSDEIESELTPVRETVAFTYYAPSDECASISKTFENGVRLDEIAVLFHRFLLAADFAYVGDVRIVTDTGMVWSSSGLQGEFAGS